MACSLPCILGLLFRMFCGLSKYRVHFLIFNLALYCTILTATDFSFEAPSSSKITHPVQFTSDSEKSAEDARFAYESEFKHYETVWLDQYGGALWLAQIRMQQIAENEFQGKNYLKAKDKYEELSQQLLEVLKGAKTEYQQQKFQSTRNIFQSKRQRYPVEPLFPKNETWQKMLEIESAAEKAAKAGSLATATYQYDQAFLLLVEIDLQAETIKLEELTCHSTEHTGLNLTEGIKKQSSKSSHQTLLEAQERKTKLEEKYKRFSALFNAHQRDPTKASLSNEDIQLISDAKQLFAQHDFGRAALTFEKILEHKPRNVEILSNLGVVRFNQQRYNEAERLLRAALMIHPYDIFSLSILGMILTQGGNYTEAIDALELGLAISPTSYECYNYLAMAYQKKGDLHAAEKAFLKCIEIRPNFGLAHFNLAVFFANQKNPSLTMARIHYKKALALGIEKDNKLDELLLK